MAKAKAKDPSEIKFEADGIVYEFVAPKIEINMGAGYQTLTAQECVEDDDVLAHLVDIGSGAIRKAQVEDDPKAPTKDQLKAILDSAEVEYDAKANKAALQVLVDELNQGGE